FFAECGKVTIRVNKEVPGHVANRLQAALWREAIHLVCEGVASLEDVDKAVVSGPGLRWSVMGPHMLFNLGSGGHGIGTFCERYRDSFHGWWDSLGSPLLTDEVGENLAAGVRAAEHGRDFADLAGERDAKLIAALQAFAAIERDSK
ncbi:MAG: 3-hydroxyacyl-CoA dehydrogenase family protein, partial [Pseudomonadota bacterium]